jgi:predicted amidohydrolase YtcJ
MNPNLIIHNAKIYTVDPTQPWAKAVACENGTVKAVGLDHEILPLAGSETEIINAEEKLVLPGFVDSHVHFLDYAIRRKQVSLFGVTDIAEVKRRLRQAVADFDTQSGLWVQGWGWDELLWEEPPTAALLDELAPDVPVVLARMDMHTWWVNSAVLKLAGITHETPDPPDARIERDGSGQPTGILREWNALDMVRSHIPQPTADVLRPWLVAAIAEVHRLGLTGIHDQRVEGEGRESFKLWQSLRRQGELKLRVHMNIVADFLPEAMALGLQPGFGDDYLWVGHVKSFADGTLGSQTAWMLRPFEGSNNTGIVVTTPERLTTLAARAAEAGFSLSVHAIGDRAVREVAAVMSEFPPQSAAGQLPHRIEHVQTIHPDDLGELARHNIYAAVQPVHLQSDWRTVDKIWGQRGRYTYAFRSLLEQGTAVAFGSDAPVAPIDPLLGIQAALTRQDTEQLPQGGWYPEETIKLEDAIAAYTIVPARLSGKAHQQGSISPGKWADMIVLDRNLFEINPRTIPETQIRLTVFDGQVAGRW